MVYTIRIFNQVFRRYDDLNASVQENVSAIRVVKAFVREDYEDKKFSKASFNLYRLFVKAESKLALINPAMMLAVYFCIISVSWLGAHFIVGGSMSTGDLTSLFSYVMGILMSLMMLSMVVVMISMSLASIRRIREVLDETPDLKDPQDPVMNVEDGSIDFNHVSFSYKPRQRQIRAVRHRSAYPFRRDDRCHRRNGIRKEQSGQSDLPAVRCQQGKCLCRGSGCAQI